MPNIDEHVVKMTFDNQQFEKGVSDSLKTIKDLKKALELDKMGDSLKGLELMSQKLSTTILDISNSAQKVANVFTPMGRLIENTLDRISNKAIDAAKNFAMMATGLQGIDAGKSKYEDYTKSVQTITNATGKSVKEVAKTLDVLMKYTDETSYDFSEMVKSIGKFTSVGIDLERAEAAMEGIANWAAKSGAGKAEANRAMYNISQAMGAGHMMLIDWKSIENANMATKEFKEVAIETAEAMGTLSKGAVNYKNFNETLKDGWLTSEVMTRVLEKYADTSTEFGLAAFHAAQEALTFTDAIDALKDSISSGWMKSLEYMFGDLDEARKLWTNVANALIEFADIFTSARNELLKGWHELGGYNATVETASNIWHTFMNVVLGVKEAIENVFPPATAENLVAITKKIKRASEDLLGSFGLDHVEEFEEVHKILADYADDIKNVLTVGSKGDFVKKLQQQLIKTGYLTDKSGADGIYGPKTQEAVKKLQKDLGVEVTGSWDEATRKATIASKKFTKTVEQVRKVTKKNVEQVTEKYKESVDWASRLNQNLGKGTKNDFVKRLQMELKRAGYLSDKANADGIYGPETEAAVKKLQRKLGVEVTGMWDDQTRQAAITKKAFIETIEKERMVYKEIQGLTGPMKRLQNIVEGIASAFKIAKDILVGVFNIAKNVAQMFDPLLVVMSRFTSMFASMFKNLSKNLSEDNTISNWSDRIIKFLGPVGVIISNVAIALDNFISSYAAFLKGDNKLSSRQNNFTNFFTYLLFYLRNNTILGPLIVLGAKIAQVILNLFGKVRKIVGEGVEWIREKLSEAFGGKTISQAIDESKRNGGLIGALIRIYENAKKIVTSISDVVSNAFSSMFKTKDGSIGKNKTATFLDNLLNILTTVANALAMVLALVGYAFITLYSLAKKYLGPVFEGIGKMFSQVMDDFKADKIKSLPDFFSSLWKSFTNTAAYANLVKVTEGIRGFFSSIKEGFKEKFPTLFEAISEKWKSFKSLFSFDKTQSLGDNIITNLKSVWKALTDFFGKVKDKVLEFVSFIGDLFTPDENGKLNILDKIRDKLYAFKPVVDWFKSLAKDFVDAWKSLTGSGGSNGSIGGIVGGDKNKGFVSVFDKVKEFFINLSKFDFKKLILPAVAGFAAYTIFNGVKSIKNISEALNSGGILGLITGNGKKEKTGFSDTVKTIAGAVMEMALAVGMLSIIDAGKAQDGFNILVEVIGLLTGVAIALKALNIDNLNIGSQALQFAGSVGLLALSLWAMMKVVNGAIGEGKDPTVFEVSLAIMVGMISLLGGIEVGIAQASKGTGGLKINSVLQMCAGVMVLVFALEKLINVLENIENPKDLEHALEIMGGTIVTLGLIEIGIAKVSRKSKSGKAKVSGILGLAGSVYILVLAFEKMASVVKNSGMKDSEINQVGAAIEIMLVTLGGMAALINHTTKNGFSAIGAGLEMIGIGVMMMIVVNAFADAIDKIKGVDTTLMGTFFVGIETSIGILGGLVYAFGKIPLGTLLQGDFGIIAVVGTLAAAIGILADVTTHAIDKFSNVLWVMGSRIKQFSGMVSDLNWDAMYKVVNYFKDYVPKLMAAITSVNADEALKKMDIIMDIAADILIYATMLSDVDSNIGDASSRAKTMIDDAKEIAEKIEKVTVPAQVEEGKLSQLGSSLLLYGAELVAVGDNVDSTNPKQMVEDAVSISQSLNSIALNEGVDKQLIALGSALKLYYASINGIGQYDAEGNPLTETFDPNTTQIDSALVSQALSALASAIPDDGTVQMITEFAEGGDNDLIAMSAGITAIGTALGEYGKSIGELKTDKVKSANKTLDAIKDLHTYLTAPKYELILPFLKNSNQDKQSLQSFGQDIVALGVALGKYGFFIGNLDAGKVGSANSVLKTIADLGKDDDSFFDNVLKVFGKQDETTRIKRFVGNITELGGSMKTYISSIEGITEEKVKVANSVINAVANIGVQLGQDGGAFSWLVGDYSGTLSGIAGNLGSLGDGIAEFGKAITYIKDEEGNITDKEISFKNVEESVSMIRALGYMLGNLGRSGAMDFLMGKQSISGFGSELAGFAENLHTFQDKAQGLDVDKMSPALTIMERIINWVGDWENVTFTDSSGVLHNKLKEVGDGLKSTVTRLSELANETVGDQLGLFGVVTEKGTPTMDAFASLADKFVQGIADGIGESENSNARLANAVGAVMRLAAASTKSYYDEFVKTGEFLDLGIVEGLISNSTVVVKAVRKLFEESVIDTANETVEVNSPSRKFIWTAQMCALGLKNGFDKYSYLVKDASMDLANSSINAISVAFNKKNIKDVGKGALESIQRLLVDDKADVSKNQYRDMLKEILLMTGYIDSMDVDYASFTNGIKLFKKEVLGMEGAVDATWYYADSLRLYDIVSKSIKADDGRYDAIQYESEMVESLTNKYDNAIVTMGKVIDKSSELNTELKKGSRGEAVKKLQEYLNGLSTTTEKLTVDGIFGSKTEQALKNYQKSLGTKESGVWDKRTINKVNSKPQREAVDTKINEMVKEENKTKEREKKEAKERKDRLTELQKILVERGYLKEGTFTYGKENTVVKLATEAFKKDLFNATGGTNASEWTKKDQNRYNKIVMSFGSENKLYEKKIGSRKKDEKFADELLNEAKAEDRRKKLIKDIGGKSEYDNLVKIQKLMVERGYLKEEDFEYGVMNDITKIALNELNKDLFGNDSNVLNNRWSSRSEEKLNKLLDDYGGDYDKLFEDKIGSKKKPEKFIDESKKKAAKLASKKAEKKDNITLMQEELERLGYLAAGKYTQGVEDDATRSAMRKMQKEILGLDDTMATGGIFQRDVDAYFELLGKYGDDINKLIDGKKVKKERKEQLKNQRESNDAYYESLETMYDIYGEEIDINKKNPLGTKSSKIAGLQQRFVKLGLMSEDEAKYNKGIASTSTIKAFAQFKDLLFGGHHELTSNLTFTKEEMEILSAMIDETGDFDSAMDKYFHKKLDFSEEWLDNGLTALINGDVSALYSGKAEEAASKTKSVLDELIDKYTGTVLGEDGTVTERIGEGIVGEPLKDVIIDKVAQALGIDKSNVEEIANELDLSDAGSLSIDGLINAVYAKMPELKAAGSNISDALTGSYKKEDEQHSPSAVWFRMGALSIEGLMQGMLRMLQPANQVASYVSTSLVRNATSSILGLYRSISNSEDNKITIRPILDSTQFDKDLSKKASSFSSPEISPLISVQTSLDKATAISYSIQQDVQQLRKSIEKSDQDLINQFRGLGDHLNNIDRDIKNLKLYIDGKKLVGGIVSDMDSALAKRHNQAVRRV